MFSCRSIKLKCLIKLVSEFDPSIILTSCFCLFFQVLHWCLSPFTIHNWLSVYLQLCYQGNERHNLGFVYSQFSPALFSQLCQLVDLATLDINSLKFSYSVIAISAVYLVCSEQLALHVSGKSIT